MKFKFVKKSMNAKTGNMAQSYSDSSTCPTRCPFKNNGCYAEYGHVLINWKKCFTDIKNLKAEVEGSKKFIRHNVAGDIAKNGTSDIDAILVNRLIKAYNGHIAYTYTHCTPNTHNFKIAKKQYQITL